MSESKSSVSVKNILIDLLKAVMIGLLAGAAIALLFLAAGMMIGGGSLAAGLEMAKNVLFFLTAMTLFLVAGMIMLKGKKQERFQGGNGWHRHFRVLGPKLVIGTISAALMILASIVDYVLLGLGK